MTMADIITIVSLMGFIGLGFPALLTIITLCFPQSVERAQMQISERPKRMMLRGAAAFLVLFFALIVLAKAPAPPLKLLSLIGLLTGISIAMVGAAGMIKQLAELFGKFTGSKHSLFNIFACALLLEFAIVLPFVGWFVMLPCSLLMMLGAGCEILFNQKLARGEGSAKPADSVNSVNSVV